MIRKLWGNLAVLLILAVAIAGCGSTSANQPNNPAPAAQQPSDAKQTIYPITVKDAAGRDVTIAAEPKRIVSISPALTEQLFAMGKGSLMTGRSEFCDFPAAAAAVPSVGGFFPPNYEAIVAAKPDLFLMPGGSVDEREKLVNEYKINVLVLDPQNFDELYAGIKLLGTVVNAQPEAEQLVDQMQQQVKTISGKVAAATAKPKVFYEVWHEPLMTTGRNTFIHDLIQLAGGENIAASVEGWANFSVEQLAAANPDYIVAGSLETVGQIQSRKGWEGMKAVKEAKVVAIDDANLLVRAGPRLVLGLQWFAETLHPELFK